MPSFKTVAVIGAGAWGTALAGVAARAGRDVVLYARGSATAAEIAATRSNPKLPGAKLEASVKVTDDIAVAAAADIVLVATPAQNLREAVTALAPHLAAKIYAPSACLIAPPHAMAHRGVRVSPSAMRASLRGANSGPDRRRKFPTVA